MPSILVLIILLAAGHTRASEACERKLDILFLVDSSYSVCNSTETCPQWNSVLQFIKNVVSSFKIGPNDTKVALMTFSDQFNEKWNLDGSRVSCFHYYYYHHHRFRRYSDKTTLLSAIGDVKYTAGEFTKLSLLSSYIVLTDIFKPGLLGGAERPKALNVVIPITDGIPDLETPTVAILATGFQVAGLTGFVVCVEPGCTEDWARGIASPPRKANETYFLVDGYFSLDSFTDNLVKQVCSYEKSLIPGLLPGNYK